MPAQYISGTPLSNGLVPQYDPSSGNLVGYQTQNGQFVTAASDGTPSQQWASPAYAQSPTAGAPRSIPIYGQGGMGAMGGQGGMGSPGGASGVTGMGTGVGGLPGSNISPYGGSPAGSSGGPVYAPPSPVQGTPATPGSPAVASTVTPGAWNVASQYLNKAVGPYFTPSLMQAFQAEGKSPTQVLSQYGKNWNQVGQAIGLSPGDVATFQGETIGSPAVAATAAGPSPVVTNPDGSTYNNPANLPEQNALGIMTAIDPADAATMNNLAKSYAPQLKEAEQFAAHPGQLDPETMREVSQAANEQEAQRGNVQGVGQAAETAMSVGNASLNLRNMQQAYLTNAKTLAQSYLAGGTNPLAASESYLNNAQNQASAASAGGPVYAPSSQPPPAYTYINPNAGSNLAQESTANFNAGVGATLGGNPAGGSQLASAGIGALSGAASGAAAGSIIPGVGTLIGGAAGALIGGAGGYFGASCWVARECLGTKDERWKLFREWMILRSPSWFRRLYLHHGERFAKFIHNKPWLKNLIARWMEDVIRNDQNKQRCDKVERLG